MAGAEERGAERWRSEMWGRKKEDKKGRDAPESFPDTAEESDSGCRIRARIIAKGQMIDDLFGPEVEHSSASES